MPMANECKKHEIYKINIRKGLFLNFKAFLHHFFPNNLLLLMIQIKYFLKTVECSLPKIIFLLSDFKLKQPDPFYSEVYNNSKKMVTAGK